MLIKCTCSLDNLYFYQGYFCQLLLQIVQIIDLLQAKNIYRIDAHLWGESAQKKITFPPKPDRQTDRHTDIHTDRQIDGLRFS